MKKLFAMLTALALVVSLVGCGSSSNSGASTSNLHWEEYDKMIADIRTESDLAKRAELMHEAEDKLMDTWCVLPIFYYNDTFMMKDYMKGVVTTKFGMKFFNTAKLENGAKKANIMLASEPDYLDPALNSSVDGGCLASNSFEGLLTYNSKEKLVPACCEKYEVSKDGTTYTFTMRDGLKWSNGKKLDAKDFVYSWKRAASAETAADYAYLYEIFADCQYDDDGNFTGLGEESVTASEDGKTLTAKLNGVCPYFLDLCAFPAFFPVYEETVTANNPDGTTPGGWCTDASDSFVCNGPYVLKSWTHDEQMVYVKNEHYRDPKSVSIGTLNFMLSSNDTAVYAAYQAGNLDFIDTVPTDELAKLLKKKNKELHVVDQLGTNYVCFNYKSAIFSDLGLDEEQAAKFRHALCLLIDRDTIIKNVGLTGQTPATSFIPAAASDGNGGTFHNKDYYQIKDYQKNVDEARKLLEEAGFTFKDDGTMNETVSFTYITNDSGGNVKVAEALQADFAQVGIDMKIETEEWNVFLEDRKAGNYDVARGGWIMDYDDPINMLEMWTTNSGNNDCQFGR